MQSHVSLCLYVLACWSSGMSMLVGVYLTVAVLLLVCYHLGQPQQGEGATLLHTVVVTLFATVNARLETASLSLCELAISLHRNVLKLQVVLAVRDHLGGVGADERTPSAVVVRGDARVLTFHVPTVDVDAEVFEVVAHDGVRASVSLRVLLRARAVAECVAARGPLAVVVCDRVAVRAMGEAAVFDVAESLVTVRDAVLPTPRWRRRDFGWFGNIAFFLRIELTFHLMDVRYVVFVIVNVSRRRTRVVALWRRKWQVDHETIAVVVFIQWMLILAQHVRECRQTEIEWRR